MSQSLGIPCCMAKASNESAIRSQLDSCLALATNSSAQRTCNQVCASQNLARKEAMGIYPTDCASRLRWPTGDGVVDSLLQSVHPSLMSARRQVGLGLVHHIRSHYPTKINSRTIHVKILIGSRKQHPNNSNSKTQPLTPPSHRTK